jgi:phenylalanyl-tRNA synthetase alpha chain
MHMEAIDDILKTLHPLEIKVLLHIKKGEKLTAEKLIQELSFNLGQCNQAFSWLNTKDLLAEKERTTIISYEITELGADYFKNGTPEERIIDLLQKGKKLTLPELAQSLNLENKDVGSAYGILAKDGLLSMNGNKAVFINDRDKTNRIKKIRALLAILAEKKSIRDTDLPLELQELISSLSKKRGSATSICKQIERDEVIYTLTTKGEAVKKALAAKGVTGEEIGLLTPELLKSGEWRKQNFRSYNINTPPVRVLLGRKNPYVEFLDKLKDKLISLGFEEYDGPLVETEFWNCDALFMPQFHSARDIHDVYYLKDPEYAKSIAEPYLTQVALTHENGFKTGSRGWGYEFDKQFTKKLILRSQGTVLSAKALISAKVPGKYFGVVRCFRYDKVDATHLADFYQTEGIVLGENVNLRTLLGLLKMFAEEVAGAKEVKYVPGYFPFTEPSVEVHIRHPELGWFELGGAGIFRPEVTLPLGINVPVLAWGLGIDRMALISLGLKDIRDLFQIDIEQVRLRRRS